MTDLVRFVDSIPAGGAAPTVRLDLNDGAMWGLTYQGTDMSPPGLKEAWAGTLLADGEQLTAAAYTNRRLKLNLDLIAPTVDAAAAQLQLLWRELNRPKNFLMWQPSGATNPVYFRTLRSSDNQVTEYPGGGGLRTVAVEIAAEPFAYGPKEQLAPVTVFNDPAGANGCWFDIAGVKGDVETPLIVSVPIAALGVVRRPVSLFAVRRRGAPSSAPFVVQAEALALGPDTTLQANDSAMSGSGSNYARVSFATSQVMQGRVVGAVGVAPGVDLRGTYRVFVRVRNTVAFDISLQLGWGPSDAQVFNEVVKPPRQFSGIAISDNIGTYYYDLGLMQIPAGGDPVHDGYSGVELPVDPATFSIRAQRDSGTATIDIDHVLFVPADDRLAFVRWPDAYPNRLVSDVAVLDGPHEQVVMLWTSGGTRIAHVGPAEVSGGFPAVSPGVTNRIFFVRAVGTHEGGVTDPITGSTVITPSYYPRYLYVRPVTT